ncbi:helix-turn-helix domain-containing protein [Kribbella swartbergensis]
MKKTPNRRQRLGLSQAGAAQRASVSGSWLAKVEAGRRGAEPGTDDAPLASARSHHGCPRFAGCRGTYQRVGLDVAERHRERSEARKRAWSAGSGSRKPQNG